MFGIAAIVAFFVAWIFWAASLHKGVILTWESFALAGLFCLAVHVATPWGRRSFQN